MSELPVSIYDSDGFGRKSPDYDKTLERLALIAHQPSDSNEVFLAKILWEILIRMNVEASE